MVAKLVIFGLLLAVVLSVAVGASFIYLKRRAELRHEEKMKDKELQAERDSHLWDE